MRVIERVRATVSVRGQDECEEWVWVRVGVCLYPSGGVEALSGLGPGVRVRTTGES